MLFRCADCGTLVPIYEAVTDRDMFCEMVSIVANVMSHGVVLPVNALATFLFPCILPCLIWRHKGFETYSA